MNFIEIQMEQWARKAHYEHYKNNVRCSYSVTVDIDISNLLNRLKEQGMKAYPVQIYMLSTVVNQFSEFRMTTNAEQHLGYWEVIDPIYTVLNPNTETFSAVWTRYNSCFNTFYRAYLQDTAKYTSGSLFPQEHVPPNAFNISSVPWLDFTAFNINVFSDGNYLLPIFTIGKYKKENDKTMMPLAIQCHHAVCDGYHVGKFVEALREMAINYNKWLL
ncbi:Chloramphenicol O-acetyltransferase [Ruminiclostridium papyrosolvens DSM 2782]|uniref:Chloramphenicol O-acetyltransferase n=1 Tax=Ruminiclostridium papyrosolvens DSM 2782 TaxID=588581 RepID=F1TEX3_9FIRM|nr:type A chloramphenicol O-acetyltransferase [Ruminiclostridium papyrosolvens]EGD46911.1 Chloramphenicol O-acetyltransferase [Ruminiclostridium papyrosolvens DSM 2782]WES33838.1 type A chloramphenicol O-acetyltransferase [Ruminiclostridium papyrosolvens DSM 2782]